MCLWYTRGNAATVETGQLGNCKTPGRSLPANNFLLAKRESGELYAIELTLFLDDIFLTVAFSLYFSYFFFLFAVLSIHAFLFATEATSSSPASNSEARRERERERQRETEREGERCWEDSSSETIVLNSRAHVDANIEYKYSSIKHQCGPYSLG